MNMKEELLDYRQAQRLILDRMAVTDAEEVDLSAALDRLLADDIFAAVDLPRYDNSAMDGFAVRSSDGAEGAELAITGTVAAGDDALLTVEPGTAVRIMTGAVIPSGADAVIPVEMVTVAGDAVRLGRRVEPGDHIRRRGEDIRRGDLALAAGTRLSPAEIGLLATFGRDRFTVRRKPRVAVLASGNELVSPSGQAGPHQIYDCNSAALCAAVSVAGGAPLPLGIARDDRQSLREKIMQGLKADILVTAAGASVGEFDLVRDLLAALGAEEVFWGVSIKPGKPTGFCLVDGVPVFCLPGNPVSALVTFALFVRPAILMTSGAVAPLAGTLRLPLAEPMRKKKARTLFARVRIASTEEGPVVTSAGSQQTGIMTALVNADGLAVLPDGRSEFAAGELVDIIPLHPF